MQGSGTPPCLGRVDTSLTRQNVKAHDVVKIEGLDVVACHRRDAAAKSRLTNLRDKALNTGSDPRLNLSQHALSIVGAQRQKRVRISNLKGRCQRSEGVDGVVAFRPVTVFVTTERTEVRYVDGRGRFEPRC